MSTQANSASKKIPKEQLDELWFAFNHSVLEQLQKRLFELEKSGETQKSIADRLGSDPAFVNRCLRGQSNMTLRTMHNLARAMKSRLKIELQSLESLKRSNANLHPWAPPTEAKSTQTLGRFRDAIKQPTTQADPTFASTPRNNITRGDSSMLGAPTRSGNDAIPTQSNQAPSMFSALLGSK